VILTLPISPYPHPKVHARTSRRRQGAGGRKPRPGATLGMNSSTLDAFSSASMQRDLSINLLWTTLFRNLLARARPRRPAVTAPPT